MAHRLLAGGYDLAVFNRTRAKTEELAAHGATVVDDVGSLGDRHVVFITVASSEDLLSVVGAAGAGGLLGGAAVPRIVVDCSTVSEDASSEARERLEARDVHFLAAPVSGNPKVAATGKLTMVVSGDRDVFDEARPYLETVARSATYVGAGDVARVVKLCHNLLLGVVIRTVSEITVLAERRGVRRRDFLAFLNESVMGSTFTRYKTPALVNLEFKPTFTTKLLRKDFDLGLDAGRALEVPMPVAALVREMLGAHVGRGAGDLDFAALVGHVAEDAGMVLEPDDGEVDDGLSTLDAPARSRQEGLVQASDGSGGSSGTDGRQVVERGADTG